MLREYDVFIIHSHFRSKMKCLLLLSAVLGLCHAGAEEAASALDLNNDNFVSQVSGSPHFVMFFAPWCGHCQHLAPTWEELHQKYMVELNVASVDCTSVKGKELCNLFNIRGYPTLLFLPPGSSVYYTHRGGRSFEDLKSYALDGEWMT